MTWKSKLLVVGGVFAAAATLLAPPSAQADQCWAVSAEQADRAASILGAHREVRLFCAPCKDRTAEAIKIATAKHAKRGEHHIVAATDLAGTVRELDLAYTYVEMKPGSGQFVNMASLVGCPAERVPERIDGAGNELK